MKIEKKNYGQMNDEENNKRWKESRRISRIKETIVV